MHFKVLVIFAFVLHIYLDLSKATNLYHLLTTIFYWRKVNFMVYLKKKYIYIYNVYIYIYIYIHTYIHIYIYIYISGFSFPFKQGCHGLTKSIS